MSKNTFTNDEIITFIKNSLCGPQTVETKEVKGKMVQKPFNETLEAHVRKLKKNKTLKSKIEKLQKVQKKQNDLIKKKDFEGAVELKPKADKILEELRGLLPEEKTASFISY